MPVSDHLVQQVVLMMIPIGRIVSSTRGLAIDGDCDGSDVWRDPLSPPDHPQRGGRPSGYRRSGDLFTSVSPH